MPLLNYTTKVAVHRTVDQIHRLLQRARAKRIMTEYDDGEPSGVAFTVETAHGERSFMLPVNSAAVLGVLERQRVERKYQTPEHAECVAWRIVKDWLEAQLAIIETEMVTLEQVMLPYMVTPSGDTVWELYADQQLALGQGAERGTA